MSKAIPLSYSAKPAKRKTIRKVREFLIASILFLCALSSVLITAGIVFILFKEALPFFETVSIWRFFTDKEWTPLFDNPQYGIAPLLCGTLLTTAVSLSIAIPVGTIVAVYLSEYAPHRIREIVKPILELLAAIPTVVYGYFALLFVTPLLQKIFSSLGGFNVLSAGIVMGVMIIPYVSSLAEDSMRAVPGYLREASFAVGASRLQTSFRVVIPAAFSGLSSAYVLAISRAVGETMVVSIAAGLQPNLTLNPLEPAATITAYIVQVSLGDLPHGSIGYRSIYVAGMVLLFMTLTFNIFGFWLRRKFREAY